MAKTKHRQWINMELTLYQKSQLIMPIKEEVYKNLCHKKLLESLKKYNILPSKFTQYADGEMFDELGDLLFAIQPINSELISLMESCLENNTTIKVFYSKKDELEFHQIVVFNYCINNNLHYNNISSKDLKQENKKNKVININESLAYLKTHNESLTIEQENILNQYFI